MQQESCQLCASGQSETKLLLTCLRRRLAKQCQQYVPDYQEEWQGDGFTRLLILVFGPTNALRPTVLHCPHTRFTRYFRRKLKCDNPTFNSLCSEVANQLAKRNYHIEILNTQLRSSTSTALKHAQHPLAPVVAEQLYAQTALRSQKQALGTSAGVQFSQQQLRPLSLPIIVVGEGLAWSIGLNPHN